MIVKQITDCLETIAPVYLQEEYDNSGLLVGRHDNKISGVLCTLDITNEVLDEAIHCNANLIVSHHPIIFSGIKSFSGIDYVSKIVEKAIKKNINLYAIHTNLDNVINKGVNSKICEIIGIKNIEPLAPKNDDKTIGSGAIGTLDYPMETMRFLKRLKQVFATNLIKHTSIVKEYVQCIAVCGGAGSFLVKNALNHQADIFITSDCKYHDFFDADSQIIIADIGHYESEQFTRELLVEILRNKFSNFAVHLSKVNTNPVQYF